MSGTQVLRSVRIHRYVERGRYDAAAEQVRCLACRRVYDKPSAGTTVGRNPGCPSCGYVGWLSVLVLVPVRDAPRPSATA